MREFTFKCQREQDVWVALCDQTYLVTQSMSLDAMFDEVNRFMTSHIVSCQEHGIDPLRCVTPDDVTADFANAPVTMRVWL